MKVNKSKKEIKRIFKQKYKEENGDLCQTGLAVAEELTERKEREKYKKIWKVIQDSAKSIEVTDYYSLRDRKTINKVAERVAENLKNPKVWKRLEETDLRAPQENISLTGGLVF